MVIIGIILLSTGIVYAGFKTVMCSCVCGEEVMPAQGFAKNAKEATKRCQDMCGRSCGAKTNCNDKCESCCEGWCSSIGDKSKSGCLDSCQKTCEFNKMIKGITDLIYLVAGIVAAIMLIIHSLRLISSQDPESREDAKKAIFFVIFALIVVGLANTLVREFAGKIEMPGGGEPIEQVTGCGGVILEDSVQHRISGNKITIDVPFINNGDQKCYYRVGLYTLAGGHLKFDPEYPDLFTVDSMEIKRGKLVRYVSTLREGYLIKLLLCKNKFDCSIVDTYTGKLPYEYQCQWEFTSEEPQFNNNEVGIPIHYANTKDEPKCSYRVVYKDRYGETVRNTNFREENDWEIPDCYLSLKDFKGWYTLVLEEQRGGDLSDEEPPVKGSLLSPQGQTLLANIEKELKECWDKCKGVGDRNAVCARFDPSNLATTDRIWRDWIEENLQRNGREDVSDALDKWYADDPLKSTSHKFVIVYRKIGDREQVQVRREGIDDFTDADPASEVCK